jgi:copper(I)-binding protein
MRRRHRLPLSGRGLRLVATTLALSLAATLLAGVGDAFAAPPGESLWLSAPSFRFIIAARPAAGYFTLFNASATPRRLIGASSPGCGMLMLHKSMEMGGVAHMSGVKGVTIPAHGKVKFEPGGYHLMCMSPTAAMRPGKTVQVILKFKDGPAMSAEFPVRGINGK